MRYFLIAIFYAIIIQRDRRESNKGEKVEEEANFVTGGIGFDSHRHVDRRPESRPSIDKMNRGPEPVLACA